jgi:uncharacterized protein YbaA (DUF1428 family)
LTLVEAAAGMIRHRGSLIVETDKEKMMAYVDGFVVAVPRARLDAYKEMARLGGTIWREYGALSFVECVEDDVKPGNVTSFPQAVQLEEGEVCVFSWITYASRADRDAITAKVMQDPRLERFMDPANMPFDGKRMIYGGFETMVEM